MPSGSRGQPLLVSRKHSRLHKFERTGVPTNAYLTVDTEFRAGGYFYDRARKPITDRPVYCEISGRSHGLHFMLETSKEFGLKATFFVEGAHTYVLGFEPMQRPVQVILAAGPDVQLHVHPMWLHGSSPRNECALTDDMSEPSEEQVAEAIEQGLQAFEVGVLRDQRCSDRVTYEWADLFTLGSNDWESRRHHLSRPMPDKLLARRTSHQMNSTV